MDEFFLNIISNLRLLKTNPLAILWWIVENKKQNYKKYTQKLKLIKNKQKITSRL